MISAPIIHRYHKQESEVKLVGGLISWARCLVIACLVWFGVVEHAAMQLAKVVYGVFGLGGKIVLLAMAAEFGGSGMYGIEI